MIICSNVLNLRSRRPVVGGSKKKISQPAAGLTNRVPVRDSRAGTPWIWVDGMKPASTTSSNDNFFFWFTWEFYHAGPPKNKLSILCGGGKCLSSRDNLRLLRIRFALDY